MRDNALIRAEVSVKAERDSRSGLVKEKLKLTHSGNDIKCLWASLPGMSETVYLENWIRGLWIRKNINSRGFFVFFWWGGGAYQTLV